MYLLHDVHVLLREGDGLDDGVHLVPHLGGLQELVSGHRGLTGGPRVQSLQYF